MDEEADAPTRRPPLRAPFSPFRWTSVFTLLLIVSSESMSLTIIQPMLPEMVELVYGVPEAQVGIIVGLLAGLPSLFSFFSSFTIG